MEDEVPSFVEEEWDCDGLDPFRDDPKPLSETESDNNNSGNEIETEREEASDNSDISQCTCQNCPKMPTTDEQICCHEIKGWMKEYNSAGSYHVIQPLYCVDHSVFRNLSPEPGQFC